MKLFIYPKKPTLSEYHKMVHELKAHITYKKASLFSQCRHTHSVLLTIGREKN